MTVSRGWVAMAGVVLTVLIAACGDGEPSAMPDLVGKRLDVAKSDLAAIGVSENDIEVVGGGVFGVITEANWTVCEQEPPSGSEPNGVRLIVDRVCGGGDDASEDPTSTTAVEDNLPFAPTTTTASPPTTAAATTVAPPPPTTAAPPPPPPAQAASCDPNYSGACVPPYPPDVDCGDIGQPVQVVGSDPHGLDRDGDGAGCESS